LRAYGEVVWAVCLWLWSRDGVSDGDGCVGGVFVVVVTRRGE
jgi:hypothetical protein